jgi:recombination associated protein RdgC
VFKNLMVYRIGAGWSATLTQLEQSLDASRFVECGATQEKAIGWIEPRGVAHGPLVESIGGQWILKLMLEFKAVPGSVLKRKLEERLAQIELAEGRKPGKREKTEIKDELKLQLLPMAFTKQGAVQVWIDPVALLLVLDAGSQGKADEVVSLLVECLPGLTVMPINTNISPVTAMAEWLTSQEPPQGFSVDRECELKAADESRAVVRYSRHPLDTEEVRQHIVGGKLPTKLALTWDNRVSLVLTDTLQIKKLTFLEVVFEGAAAGGKDDGFDADVAIATGELQRLIPDLLEALGGEVAAV